MRLIDADALWHHFAAMQECVSIRDHMYLMGVISIIDRAPDVDAAPVVHARWVHRCRYIATEIWEWCCSACGELPPGPNQCAYELRYCPSCGAKMDGGADE